MPEPEEDPCWERQLRKQLLLLATVVVSFTYAARINPPGGVWQENGPGYNAGDMVLLSSHRGRYLAFCYCNSTALTASVVVIFLLLLKKPRRGAQLVLLRVVMLLDLLGLVGAYAAGSNRDDESTLHVIYSGSAIILHVALQVFLSFHLSSPPPEQEQEEEEELDDRTPLKPKEWRKVLMLLATFTMASTYMAGLSSSGGHWDRIDSRNSKQGHDAFVGLDHKAKVRFKAFFYCNTTAFIASLFLVLHLLSHNIVALALSWLLPLHRTLATGIQCVVLYVLVLAVLLGLLGAYTAGNCPDTYTIVFVLCLCAAFLACIFLVMAIACCHRQCISGATTTTTEGEGGLEQASQAIGGGVVVQLGTREDESRKVKPLILLLATITANITYQAGVNPPGGLWPNDDEWDGHRRHYAGDPILLSTNPWRYKVFLYCNSSAFVLSLNAILTLLVYKEHVDNPLLVLMILDMVALMGSYTAGSWRDARCSIYVLAMAVGVILYVMMHLLYVTVLVRRTDTGYPRPLEKRHKRLLLVAILVATITYQAGLSPPGGFRRPHEDGRQAAAGAVLLLDKHPRRFWAFFYCNTVSFVATMALNLFVVSPNLYRQRAVRYCTLYVCIVLALLGLMAASSAGIVQTYAYGFVLHAVLVSIIAIRTIRSRSFLLKEEEPEEDDDEGSSGLVGPATIPRPRPRPRQRSRFRLRSAQETKYRQAYTSHKHLMLLGILAASATYQAGFKLKQPGGLLWHEDDGNSRSQGFFYINSTSFVTSVFVVALQLLWRHQPMQSKLLVLSTNTALVLDMLGLMAAYAIGAAIHENEYALIIMILLCMPVHVAPWILFALIKCIKRAWSVAPALR